MTNGEKYKTAKERLDAFRDLCNRRETLMDVSEFALWLNLEVEEKPMPCPYCNNEYVEVAKAFAGMRDVRCICGYRSQAKESEAEAIAAHNRLCKAVEAYNESEAK